MNSPDRRDEQLERMLWRSAGPTSDPTPDPRGGDADLPAEDCLDAETAAAWADGALSGVALATAQAHAADCVRCQALVATLLRSSGSDRGRTPVRPRTSWLRRWQGWLVPAMAAAAAALVWVAVVREPSGPTQESTGARVEFGSPSAVAPPMAQPERPAPTPSPAESAQQGSTAVATRPDPAVTTAAPRATAELTEVGPGSDPGLTPVPSPSTANEARLENQALTDAPRSQSEAAAKSAAGAAALPAAPPAAAYEPSQPAPSPLAAADAAPPPPAVAVPSPAASSGAARPAPATRAAIAAAAPARAVDDIRPLIESADPSVSWRLLERRYVERSTDAGATWQRLQTPDGLVLSLGFAPSAAVCWIVGERGAILRTTDGRTFQRLAFPEPLDLFSISASSPTAATVVAKGGRRFSTTDGRNWTEQ